jgi:hypothetical protein
VRYSLPMSFSDIFRSRVWDESDSTSDAALFTRDAFVAPFMSRHRDEYDGRGRPAFHFIFRRLPFSARRFRRLLAFP